MNNNFYIFLDIDGVLNHIDWFKKYLRHDLEKDGYHLFFCPENISNLNILLNYYKSNNFTPKIIITSTWRTTEKDFRICTDMLLKNGLNYSGTFDKTALKPRGIRGRQIKNYMYYNNIDNNFVVIDDKMKYITPYFHSENIIKASGLFQLGLSKRDVENYIEKQKNKDFSTQY